MRRRKVDSNLERLFLIGLISSKPFLASAAGAIDAELIQAKPVGRVIRWCQEYWTEHGDAPGRNIETMFHAWAEKDGQDDTEKEMIADLLAQVSAQADGDGQINVPYLLDQLGVYLSSRKLAVMTESVSASLMRGDTAAAIQEVGEFRAVELGMGCGVDPLNDRAVWARAFEDPSETLVSFPGDAGKFLNPALTRDALIAIQGPEKRGKTFWCVELVLRALRNHLKVALFEVGDMSESQIVKRLGVRLTGLPMWKKQVGVIKVPIDLDVIKGDKGEEAELTTKDHVCSRTVNWQDSWRACKRFLRDNGMLPGQPHLKFSIHPTNSINVEGIAAILSRWEYEQEFVPDVIVVDYADILAPEKDRKDFRHQTNDTWMALRKLSQEKHALVVAPTQATRDSYDAEIQTMKHASEDKRKMAHCTGMLGLNQKSNEKTRGVMRLNWVLLRESDYVTERCLWVGQCLPLARAFCCATL